MFGTILIVFGRASRAHNLIFYPLKASFYTLKTRFFSRLRRAFTIYFFAPARAFYHWKPLFVTLNNTFFSRLRRAFTSKNTAPAGENLTAREARRKKIVILK